MAKAAIIDALSTSVVNDGVIILSPSELNQPFFYKKAMK